jgi:signal transduction histidine kinase
MMQLVSENLQLLFGLSSTIFFFPDHDQTILTGIASHSKNIPSSGSFTIKIKSQRSLVTESALQQTILNSQNQNIFAKPTIIDRQIQDALMSSHFICLPLISGKLLMGVIAIGCDTQQIEKINKDNELLCLFSTIVANSLSHQQQLAHKHQQQLELKQQEIDIQTRKIIHEVNNPLTIINNYLEILSLDMDKDSKNKLHIETIKSEMDRVSEILLQLKDDQTEMLDEQPMVNINSIISKLVDIFKPTFYKLNQITSQLELDPDLPLISTNQNKFKQIITNLLRNSAEALPESGTITINNI